MSDKFRSFTSFKEDYFSFTLSHFLTNCFEIEKEIFNFQPCLNKIGNSKRDSLIRIRFILSSFKSNLRLPQIFSPESNRNSFLYISISFFIIWEQGYFYKYTSISWLKNHWRHFLIKVLWSLFSHAVKFNFILTPFAGSFPSDDRGETFENLLLPEKY